MPRALVLEPTRELADQVAESFNRYSKYSKLSHALLIGGVSMDDQTKKLDRGVDVLIATPGRLLDHFERGRLMLSQVNILVIDEADRMLDMGFIPDVERICKLLPFTRQTLFYSATMPPEIQRLTDQFLHNPVRIEVSRPATTAANITQELVEIPANDWAKREALRRLIREAEPTLNNAIVFCNRKRDVDVVAKSLAKHGFDAAPIHGDLDQSLRTKTLDRFRAGELKILVASDVAARGLDVPGGQPCLQFRRADPCRRLCPPHRPHRPRRPQRPGLYAGLAARRQICGFHRKAHRQQAGAPPDDRPRSARRPRARDATTSAADASAAVAASAAMTAVRRAANSMTRSRPSNPCARPRSKPACRSPPFSMRRSAEHKPRHEQPRHERTHREHKPHPEKKAHDKPRSRSNDAEVRAVDKSELPAFLFRKVPVAKREPQE